MLVHRVNFPCQQGQPKKTGGLYPDWALYSWPVNPREAGQGPRHQHRNSDRGGSPCEPRALKLFPKEQIWKSGEVQACPRNCGGGLKTLVLFLSKDFKRETQMAKQATVYWQKESALGRLPSGRDRTNLLPRWVTNRVFTLAPTPCSPPGSPTTAPPSRWFVPAHARTDLCQ